MRLIVCAGGTGGGVYPALSILQAAQEMNLVDEVLWIGGESGMEGALVDREGIPFRAIPAAGINRVNIRSLPGNLLRLVRGYFAARKAMQVFNPDVILFTGGYVAGPVAFAGRHVPMLLYVPDIEPAWALKFLARFADKICLIAEESKQYFPGSEKLIVTGHPTRKGLRNWDAGRARQELDLEAGLPVLLVFGGSLGARSINYTVLDILPALLQKMQVVHITGDRDWPDLQARFESLPSDLAGRYHPTPYLHDEMGAAYAAADLILSRAGASSVGEFPLFGKAAILVPYPNAWRYQKVNAGFLVRKGAAVELLDEQMREKLLETILDLIEHDDKRNRMGSTMKQLGRPDAAWRIAEQLKELAGAKSTAVKGSRP